ncbi:MAG: hypothetical protein U0798_03245 [Gemmataceae bacterium]
MISKPKDTLAVTDLFNEECIDSHSKIVDLAHVEFLTRRGRYQLLHVQSHRLEDYRSLSPAAVISGRKKKQNSLKVFEKRIPV